MQIRPKLPGTYRFIKLPEDFPATCSSLFTQTDAPIRLLHRHNVAELGYCHEGEGVWVVEEKLIPFSAGDVVFITGNEMHLARSREGSVSKWTWIYFDPGKLLALSVPGDHSITDLARFQGRLFPNVFSAVKYPRVNALVRDVIEEFATTDRYCHSAIRCVLHAFLVQMHRLSDTMKLPAQIAATRKQSDHDWERIRPAIQKILSDYQLRVSVPALAYQCAMSITNFRRTFLRATGRTPQQYLLAVRVSMACIELRSGMSPVSRIALDNGFTTMSSFTRKFREITGTTPRKWRTGDSD